VNASRRRLFLVLWGLGVLGAVAGLPYKMALWPPHVVERYPLGALLATDVFANGIVITGLLTYFGLRAGKPLGLGAPVLEGWVAGERVRAQVRRLFVVALLAGGLSALAIILLEVWVFAPRLPQLAAIPEPAAWKGALGALYGGVTEELITRLGMFSVTAGVLTRLGVQRTGACWAANAITSVLFGIMHLSATAGLLPLTLLVVSRALLLNGIASLVFGHLYWTRGLEAAMLAHFAADIVLHVLPALIPTF